MTQPDPITPPLTHYILDARSCVGNCALWWRPGGKGYTCELDQAGLFTEEAAGAHRRTDVPVHKDVARRLVVSHVRWEHLRDNGVDISGANR